jgi:DNA polymerase III delta prime subunit
MKCKAADKTSPVPAPFRTAIRVDEPCPSHAPRVQLINGASIRPEPIDWLWQGWLARRKMHLIGGQPGTGKTTIALALAAVATRAGKWPDGGRCESAGNVVIWSGEDDPDDTLAPRLIAAGAEMRRTFFVGGVDESGRARDFDPAKDIGPLREAIVKAGGAAIVIVDPIVSAVAGDSHKNAETRRALQPLVDLCRSIDAALIGVTHFTKGTSGREPIERITGSLAFGALARIVMVAAKQSQPEEESLGASSRLFARAKSNIGPDGDGFSYELVDCELQDFPGLHASRVAWGGFLPGTARELLAEAETIEPPGNGGLREAEAFLRDLLSRGPVATNEIKSAASGNAIAWRTIERAKHSLGVQSSRVGGVAGAGKWEWGLNPPATSPNRNLGGLSDDGGLSDSDVQEVEL